MGAELSGSAAERERGQVGATLSRSEAKRERGQVGAGLSGSAAKRELRSVGSAFGKRAMLYGSGVLDGDDDCPLPSAPAAVRKLSEASDRFRKGVGSFQKLRIRPFFERPCGRSVCNAAPGQCQAASGVLKEVNK